MSISDNEKDELVQVVMKHASDASDIVENFEKMDPNSEQDFFKFRKFILEFGDNEAENLEAHLSEVNRSRSSDRIPERGSGTAGNYGGNQIPVHDKPPAQNIVNVEREHIDNEFDRLNNQINQRNNQSPNRDNPVQIKQDSQHSRPAEVPPINYGRDSQKAQKSELNDSSQRSLKLGLPTPKSIQMKPIYGQGQLDDEEDLDFDIPGERSSRDNRNQYFQSNLNDQDYSPRDQPKELAKATVSSGVRIGDQPEPQYKVPADIFNRVQMDSPKRDNSMDHFQVPEEKSKDGARTPLKELNLDPMRLDLLEEDEPPAVVPVTDNFAFKKQLHSSHAVSDNGEFKRFYEEKAFQNMGEIAEEPYEGESAMSSQRKKASDLFANSQHYRLSSFKQEEPSKKSSPKEKSAESFGAMKNMPVVTAPKFIASTLNEDVKSKDSPKDLLFSEPAPKVKCPTKVLSFKRPLISDEEDTPRMTSSIFKAPSPRLIWNPLTAPEPKEDEPVRLIIGNPTVTKIKEEPKETQTVKISEELYTKEEVNKVVEEKMKAIEAKYSGLETELNRLHEELKQKKEEDPKQIGNNDVKMNSFSSMDKPKTALRLLQPAKLGANLAWINKNHEDQLKMKHEEGKVLQNQTREENTLLAGINDTDMDAVSKIISFARGTTLIRPFDLLSERRGRLFQNDHMSVDVDIENDLRLKDGNYYMKMQLNITNKSASEIGGIVPKILDPTQSMLSLPQHIEFWLNQPLVNFLYHQWRSKNIP